MNRYATYHTTDCAQASGLGRVVRVWAQTQGITCVRDAGDVVSVSMLAGKDFVPHAGGGSDG